MFRKYVNYLRDNPEHYWFKRRVWGWGWTPATWPGWFLTLGYIVLMVGIVFLPLDEDSNLLVRIGLTVLLMILLTGIFIWILYKKGEKPKWQWGFDEEDQQKD